VVLTLTGLAIGHEAVTSGTETPVASRCVYTLVLTGVPRLTLVDVCWSYTHTHTHTQNSHTVTENIKDTLRHAVVAFSGRRKARGSSSRNNFPPLPRLHPACLHGYLSRSHPWTQTPADKRGGPARGSLCGSASCCAPLWRGSRGSGSSERPGGGTAAGRSRDARQRVSTPGSRTSNSRSRADAGAAVAHAAPATRRVDAPLGTGRRQPLALISV